MNPGSGFGSGGGFGQKPSSTPGFGTTTGSSTFGTSGSQAFASETGGTSVTDFGATSSSTVGGFGANVAQGFGSAGSANQSFGQSSGGGFRMPGAGGSVFGSTSATTQGLGAGLSSGGPVSSGTASGFGTGTASFTGSGSGSTVFGASSFGGGSTFRPVFGSATSTSSASFGGEGGTSMFGATSGPGFGTGSTSTSGFGTGSTGTSGFGKGSSGTSGFGVTGSSGFGTGSTGISGFGTGSSGTAGFGTGSTGISGFGTGSTGLSGFGTGSTTTSGFGTELSRRAGFGTGSTSSSGFGTGATGTSGFGAGATGTSGFGTGATSTSGFGAGATGTSGFGTGATSTSAFGTGSSTNTGFGTGSRGTSGFGTGSTGASGFGTGAVGGFSTTSSVFGTSTKSQESSSTPPSTQGSSMFGGMSVFGQKTGGSSAPGPVSTASSAAIGSSQGGSVFGGHTSSKPPGLGGSTGSVFGQQPASSAFVSSSIVGTAFGGASSLGGKTSTAGGFGSSLGGKTSTAGGFGSSLGGKTSTAGGFGAKTTTSSVPSVFGTKSSVSSGVFGGVSQQGGARGFGADSKHTQSQQSSSSVFGGATKPVLQQGSVFGGAGKPVIKQEESAFDASSQPESRAMLFPAAAPVSKSSVFGGTQPTSDSTFAPGVSSSQLFRGQNKPSTTQQTSASSVFGGKMGTAIFGQGGGLKQTEKPADQTASVFGGRTSGEGGAGFPGHTATASGPKQHHEQKGIFGIFSKGSSGSQKRIADEDEGMRETKRGRAERVERGDDQPSSSGSPEKGALRRSSSVMDDTSSKTTICVKGIPANLNKRSLLRSHFLKFGRVMSTRSQPAKGMANVKFETHEGAAKAKKGGGKLPGQQKACTIFWRTSTAERSPSTTEDVASARRPTWRSSPQKTAVAEGGRFKTSLPSSVASELDSMGQVDGEAEEEQHRRPVQKPRQLVERETTRAARKRTPPPATSGGSGHAPSLFTGEGGRFTSSSVACELASMGQVDGEAEEEQYRRPFRKPRQLVERETTRPARERTPPPATSGGSGHAPSLFTGEGGRFKSSSVASELASMGQVDGEAEEEQHRRHVRKSRQLVERETTRPARERTPPPATSGGSGHAPAKSAKVDAASLYKMVGTTLMEKVNILDTRDKLIRQILGKQVGSVNSKAFVGACPDMCPEKERLYREEVRRLSLYEIIPGSTTMGGWTSQVDHTRAVKEYSRSSADQDEPLPHELRPTPVLMMTMNYLLQEIADQGEDGKWSEWYDFLWNRTRSIRKDITQQQLCSIDVVELLEKCVRFHIYCSERLCMEDMMVFDEKINNENLTKCLQTLKELYHDMENKHGLFCPNEAEFRAYMVLMNLNEGDTLREVQQLRPQVRDSPEISFSVKMYSALNSNNYVRFFRVVKTASFLNACILHRYFNQIRGRALQVILRSYTAGAKKVGFPLQELMRLLAFEREEEVREFCAYYGLLADGPDLALDRSAYIEPESSIPAWRAVGLVESKRIVSVGEVINGKALEPLQLPPPQCSFDEHGRFIGKLEGVPDMAASSAKDGKPFATSTTEQKVKPVVVTQAEEKVQPFAVKPIAAQPALQPSPLQLLDVSNDVVKMIARELFWEIIGESAHTIAESCVAFCQQAMVSAGDVADQYVSSVSIEMAREVSVEVMEDEKERQDEVAEAEQKERKERATADVTTSFIFDVLDVEIRQIAFRGIQEARAKHEAERRERGMLAVSQDLLQEVTAEMSLQVADEVHEVDVVARLELLADLQKAVELKRVSKWLAIWRKALIVRQRQKRAMLDFPCAPPMGPASRRLRDMFPDRPAHLSALVPGKAALMVTDRARVTLLSPLDAEQASLSLTAHLTLASLVNSLRRSRAWHPLNLGSLLRAPVLQSVQAWPPHLVKEFVPMGIQWKLLLSLPGDMEIEDDDDDNCDDDMTGVISKRGDLMAVLKQWLGAKLTHGEGNASPANRKEKNILSRYSTELAAIPGTSFKLRLSVCVRNVPEFSGTKKDKSVSAEQCQVITKGTSAILFLLPHADTTDDTKWLAARLRLARMLEAKPMLPPTPLVLLLPCSPDTPSPSLTADTTERVGIEGFQEQGLVSDVAVVELPVKMGQPADVAIASQTLQSQVMEAVKFLGSKMPEPPDLRCQRLGDLVEDTLTQHFFTPVLQDLRLRQQRDKLHQAPNAVIGLFNSVLDHIALALTSSALQDFSWPAPELQQTADAQNGMPGAEWNSNKHLADVYELVANLRLPWFQYKDRLASDWGQVCSDVWAFVDTVVKKRCDSAVSLTTRISHILAKTCLQFETMCSLTHNEDHCTPTYVNTPWTDIILACVDFRLKRLHSWQEEEEEAMGGEVEVFYDEEDLEGFEPPAAWVQAMLDTEDLESHRVEETVEQAAVMHYANKTTTSEHDFTTNNLHHHHLHSSSDEEDITYDSNNSGMETRSSYTNKTLSEAAQDLEQLPDEMRSAFQTSQKLLLHVEEERHKARAFQDYLEKAVRGETLPDVDASGGIFPQSPSASMIGSPGLRLTASGGQAAGAVRNLSHQPNSPYRTPARNTLQLSTRPFPRRLVQSDSMAGNVSDEAVGVEEEGGARTTSEEHEPISQRLEQLKEDLQAQRYASQLYEKRLQGFLES
ncbi:germinal-center associated nuclear protein-like isoform X2 [Littorina saxatilis]|uniref:germinal-center associated nuclear protein-like isoform X2 n=1 Tax=Littorina saxatilis TaxID=31220 RepID=UPI0038B58A44